MTPEEEALLRARLGDVNPSLGTGYDYASAFRNRVMGIPQVQRAGEVVTGMTPGTPLALSRKAAGMVGDPLPGSLPGLSLIHI